VRSLGQIYARSLGEIYSRNAIRRDSSVRTVSQTKAEKSSFFVAPNTRHAEMSPRMDGWSIYVISHISGHISTRKCARRLINVTASLSRRVMGIGGVRTLNSRRVRRMTMVYRFVLPERTLPRRFVRVATNGAGSSVTGSPQRGWTPVDYPRPITV